MANQVSSGSGLRRLESLARHFRHLKLPPIAADFHKRAAVLVCLFEDEKGEIRVILTKRASTLSSYSGEVSLPGGKVEKGDDSYVETALSEAKEEIGLNPSGVTIITVLDPFTAKEDVLVSPVIGFLSNKTAFNPSPRTEEVEAIFDTPLEMFLKAENRRGEEREWRGEKFICDYFDFKANNNETFVIWALTAAVLITTATIVFDKPPEFHQRRLKSWTIDPPKPSSAL